MPNSQKKNNKNKPDERQSIDDLIRESLELARRMAEDAARSLEAEKRRSIEIDRILEKAKREENRLIEFAQRREYESEYDYAYRVRNVPARYLDSWTQVVSLYSEEELIGCIEHTRELTKKDLANNVIVEYSQKEIISAKDVFYSVRHGKRYKYNRCKVRFDWEHYNFYSENYFAASTKN